MLLIYEGILTVPHNPLINLVLYPIGVKEALMPRNKHPNQAQQLNALSHVGLSTRLIQFLDTGLITSWARVNIGNSAL